MRILRISSVFRASGASLNGAGVRFDPVGGMQNHVFELTRALDGLGLAQSVITTRPPGASRFERVGKSARVLRLGFRFPQLRQLYSLPASVAAPALAASADVVHVHAGRDLAAAPLAFAAATAFRLPVVLTIHSSFTHTLSRAGERTPPVVRAGRLIETAAARRANAVVAITPALAAHLARAGLDPSRIHVAPPAVDASLFTAPHPDPFPDIPRPRLLFVGRLAPEKGVSTLVDAAALAGSADLNLVLIGDGPLRPRIERAIRDAGLGARVHLAGFATQRVVAGAMAHSDALVLPSIAEELGMAALEALQAGLPVIASRTGGIPDVVRDLENGMLVAPGDSAALAAAVERFLGEPELARKLSDGAAGSRNDSRWSDVAERYLGIYETVAGGMPRHARHHDSMRSANAPGFSA
jgi:glycosyltransferase involved in cell wall biosynthesis